MSGIILAVDGGGTGTRAGAYDRDGTLLCEGAGPPSNPVAYGEMQCARAIEKAAAGFPRGIPAAVAQVYAGLAGAGNAALRARLAERIGLRLHAERVLVVSDAHALLHANAGEAPGVLAIAGTGAIALACDGRGNWFRQGGWGSLFGDEGSAFAIARTALTAAARALDGVGPETTMTQLLPAAAGLGSFQDFVAWSAEADKSAVAALAKAVSEAAGQGDIPARSCIEEQARRLAALVVSAQERMSLPGQTAVFEHGGVFDHCSRYRESFRASLAAYSEMRPVPCARRGHAAAFMLASLDGVPEWAGVWTRQGGSVGSLPPTESGAAGPPLDQLSSRELVRCMNRADAEAVAAVAETAETVAAIIDCAAACLIRGGRIIYVGAGTSGRLGVLDASECPPTFGVKPDRVLALIAGGERAVRHSVEGAEDDIALGCCDLLAAQPNDRDVVIGITASGTTPYVAGALDAARQAGAETALITSNPDPRIAARHIVVADTGPEVLAGSTRLKAGTAAKMVLNMISTGAMAQAGLIYRGRMIGMAPANHKLRERAGRIIAELAGITPEYAAALLEQTGGHIATALIMAARRTGIDEARRLIEEADGRVAGVLDQTCQPDSTQGDVSLGNDSSAP